MLAKDDFCISWQIQCFNVFPELDCSSFTVHICTGQEKVSCLTNRFNVRIFFHFIPVTVTGSVGFCFSEFNPSYSGYCKPTVPLSRLWPHFSIPFRSNTL